MFKKRFIALLLVFVCLALCCCSNDLDIYSKNLDNYEIAASFDDVNKKVSVVQKVQYTHRQEQETDSVKFRIYANSYSQEAINPIVPVADKVKAYKNGYSYGEITIDSVSVDGDSVAFTIEGDGTILSVNVPDCVFLGEKIKIEIVYEICLANVWHRLGYGDNTVNLGNWFAILCPYDDNGVVCTAYSPLGDPFISDCANYNVSLIVPSRFTVASSGSLVSTEIKEQNTIYNIEGKCLRDFAVVLSDKYQVESKQVGEVTVNYYYFEDTSAQTTLELCCNAISYFESVFGKYPYSQLSVCQTDFCYGGMEYPNLVYVSPNETKTYYQAAVHEIAHQWLYGIVGSDQISNAWQDEGLSEFVTLLFLDKFPQYEISFKEQIALSLSAYCTYVDVLGSYLPTVDTSMTRSLHDYVGEQEYIYINYVKGCLMFYDLYGLMGETKFLNGCSKYCSNNKYLMATPQNLFDSFSAAYGSDLTPWFTAYITGQDILAAPE